MSIHTLEQHPFRLHGRRFRPVRPISRRRIVRALAARRAAEPVDDVDWDDWDKLYQAELDYLRSHPFDRYCHCHRCQA